MKLRASHTEIDVCAYLQGDDGAIGPGPSAQQANGQLPWSSPTLIEVADKDEIRHTREMCGPDPGSVDAAAGKTKVRIKEAAPDADRMSEELGKDLVKLRGFVQQSIRQTERRLKVKQKRQESAKKARDAKPKPKRPSERTIRRWRQLAKNYRPLNTK